MKYLFAACAVLGLAACGPETATDTAQEAWTDLSLRAKPAPITTEPWQEIVIGVPDLDDVPRLFTDIGGFTMREQSRNALVLGAPGVESGLIRFHLTPADAAKTRPFGSRSWDTGCYFSVMMRAKNLSSIIEDAAALGWTPLTDMAYLEFGPSKLNIVVLGHEKTGIQVQLYERLTTPIPEGFPDFERLSRPFNMMQMVRARDAAYTFYQQGLGFETFYYGKPSVSAQPEVMPLGIPVEMTTTTPYQAGIVTPKLGLEWGRMEMIEVMMSGGKDLSSLCAPGNIGITEVHFFVDDIDDLSQKLSDRGVNIYERHTRALRVKTPDGANIRFIQK